MAEAVQTPYSAAKRLIPPNLIPTWINEYDASRLAAYDLYENIYWTEPQTFKLQQRGSEENPIYIPSGRIIVNTMDRYTARDWTPIIDPAFGQEAAQLAMMQAFNDLIKRERLLSGFESNKLFGIMRGDWCWYITASPTKLPGTRLSVRAIDPRMVLPINPNKDVDRVIGYDLVEQVTVGDDLYIHRTRYLKSDSPDYPFAGAGTPGGPISYQVELLEIEEWENPEEQKVYQVVEPPVQLPMPITNLPVYHIKNFDEPGNPFGSSEMRGLERVMAAVNQSITDEELALALQGLGMYKSSKGQPRNAAGVPVPWSLGPGKVVHDESFDRVTGVTSVTPHLDHIRYLEDKMHEVTGASDVARGKVDVTVAESGIALQMRMGPILDTANKKDKYIREVMDNLLYDLRDWFKAYEGLDFTETRVISSFGQKLPKNVEEEFSRLLQMVSNDPPLITMGYFRDACRELGINIPISETGQAIAQERAQFAELADPMGARLNEEIDNAEDELPAADQG